MSAFGGLIFTNKGRNLQAKAQAGAQLNFTRIAVGDGDLGGSSIADLNDLKHQVKSISITKLKVLTGGKAVVGGSFSNQDIVEGFYWKELGVFAEDPDLGEVLYCYGNAGANAEYIPAGGGPDVVEKSVDVVTIIGNAANVIATIEESLVYYTQDDVLSVDQTQVPATPGNGKISQLFNWLTNRIKTITGKANWWDAPVKTIQEIWSAQTTHAAEKASDTELGHVKPDGVTTSVDVNGVISAVANTDVLLRDILRIKLRQTGLNIDPNAWSDTLEDTTGINAGASSKYVFDATNKSLKVASAYDENHVGVWKFDETSGSSCSATKGTATGTCTGTTIVDGYSDKARSFNGTSDKIVFNAKVIPQGAKTIRFKIKQNGAPANDKAILCESSSLSSGANGMVIRLNTTGHLQFLVGQSSSFIVSLMSSKNVCNNAWHDVMFTWDGTTNSGGAKLYIDTLSSPETATATATQTTTATKDLNIGYDTSTSTSYFGGVIDELEISNVVRTVMPDYTLSEADAIIVWTAQTSVGTITKAIVESVATVGTGTIKYYVSRDNGVTYTQCTLDTITDVSAQPAGTNIVLKAVMTGNAELFAVAWGGIE